MNFKLILLLFIFSACGVKGPPLPPVGTTGPSYIDKCTYESPADQQQAEKIKKKK